MNPTHNKISIKTEKMVEQCLGIKIEPNNDDANHSNICETENAMKVKEESEVNKKKLHQIDEKKTLINELNAVRSEYQLSCFNLNKKIDYLQGVCAEKDGKIQQMQCKINTLSTEHNLVQSKINKIIMENSSQKTEREKTIALLSTENKQLAARVKQLQSQIVQTAEKSSPQSLKKKNENEYEVEKLLGDKIKHNIRYYLVRWKGYSSKHDTWEPISNILCPKILEEYYNKN